MHASELLGGYDDATLRARLLPVLPEQVGVRPLPRRARGLLPRWVAAVTLPWAIYIRADVLTQDPDRLSRLLVHELVHVRQWKTYGPVGFLRRYIRDYLAGRLRRLTHREAYLRIGLEAEAHAVVAGLPGPSVPP